MYTIIYERSSCTLVKNIKSTNSELNAQIEAQNFRILPKVKHFTNLQNAHETTDKNERLITPYWKLMALYIKPEAVS